jgi:hypothetical protein
VRTVNPRNLDRLSLDGLPATERQQAIAKLLGEQPRTSRHKARQIEASDASERCHTCGEVVTATDRGEAMERHIEREHAGNGGSSLVL